MGEEVLVQFWVAATGTAVRIRASAMTTVQNMEIAAPITHRCAMRHRVPSSVVVPPMILPELASAIQSVAAMAIAVQTTMDSATEVRVHHQAQSRHRAQRQSRHQALALSQVRAPVPMHRLTGQVWTGAARQHCSSAFVAVSMV